SNLWIATYGGLCKVIFNGNNVAFSTITFANGVTVETIPDLICDNQGNLWFTCPDGLAMKYATDNRIRYYTSNDGLKSEYTSLQLFKVDDGEIYMGLFGGYFH